MISRYAIKEIDYLCSDNEKLKRWFQVELAVINGLYKYKFITKTEWEELNKKIQWSLNLTNKYEKETKHDVFAFILSLNKLTKTPLKRWIHYGITSTDIVDTANGMLYKEINKIILNELNQVIKIIKKLAIKHKYTIMLARTHGQNAEPTTLGFKLINWFDQLQRTKQNFQEISKLIEVGKISGAVGTYAHLPNIEFEKYVCKSLKLNAATISTQILSRDRHAYYFSSLILLINLISSFANEIRLLALEDVNELNEGFGKKQKGSSAMPQKKNPINCENICGLSRIIKSYSSTIYDNITLWHERDISHSSTERILNQDFLSLVVYILRKFNQVLNNLVVNKQNMLDNLAQSEPKIYAQTIMLYLIKEHNMDRIVAYEIIKKYINNAKNIDEIIKIINSKISKPIELKNIKSYMEPRYHIRHIPKLIESIIKIWE
ncbi:adenylosuccinate lyase [Mycoplasmoides alvi]|uniref:adenylosuccinate lyase n=1 Tax=Mycoplasmoides alvi TaxID=78580 RepID=UPI00051BD7EB|nr:adenylosuccinate lyase [Mycoplasmoides alvi]